MPKVSVIIPVYNTEKYLKKCMDSILAQSLRDIEIIVVNDGSKDGSLNILQEYSKRDNRIMLINQKNLGQSSARNEALKVATGEYIGFVDSDDWVENTMFEELYTAARIQDADIAICNYTIVYEQYERDSIKSIFNIKNEVIDIKKIGLQTYLFDYMRQYKHKFKFGNIVKKGGLRDFIRGCKHGNEVWTRIYKTKLIKENRIYFEFNSLKGIPEIAEDMLFNMKCSLHASKVVGIESSLYNYLIRQGSSTTSYRPNILSRALANLENFEIYAKKYINEEELNQLIKKLTYSMLKEDLIYLSNQPSKEELDKEIQSLYNNIYFNKVMKYSKSNFKINDIGYYIFVSLVSKRRIYLYIKLEKLHLYIKPKNVINKLKGIFKIMRIKKC